MKERWDERCQALLVRAKEQSLKLQNYFFGTEHLLLAMLGDADSMLLRLLHSLHVDPQEVEKRLLARVAPPSTSPPTGFPLSPRVRQIVVTAEQLCEAEGGTAIGEAHLLTALLRGGRGVAVRVLEEFGIDSQAVSSDLGSSTMRTAPRVAGALGGPSPRTPGTSRETDGQLPAGPPRKRPVQGTPEPDKPVEEMPDQPMGDTYDPDQTPSRPELRDARHSQARGGETPPPQQQRGGGPTSSWAPAPAPPPQRQRGGGPASSGTPAPAPPPQHHRGSETPHTQRQRGGGPASSGAPAPAPPPQHHRESETPPPQPRRGSGTPQHQRGGDTPRTADRARSRGGFPVTPVAANQVLIDFGIVKKPTPPSATPTLDRVGRDLTALTDELGAIVGRKQEIDTVARALCRASRNNPLLVGESGVGKTAIVEGLALAIAAETVPAALRGVRVVELPGAALQGEDALDLIEEARKHNVILAVDDIHILLEPKAQTTATRLGTWLSRGELRVIGTSTTPLGDSTMARYFHSVRIEEPSDETTLDILRAVRDRFEPFHEVEVPDETLSTLLLLARAYLQDRKLPLAAIDLLDEACVRGIAISRSDIRPLITPSTVIEVLSQWTGLPAATLAAEDLSSVEVEIRQDVVGQDEAVARVCERLRMHQAGFRDEHRPVAVFLFQGPCGVGKRQTARALARAMFHSEQYLHRLDLTDDPEKQRAGSPGVFLLEDVEQAPPRALKQLSQRLSDGDYSHSVIIMTAVNPPPATFGEPADVIEFRPLEPSKVHHIAERLVEHWKKKSLHKGYPLEVGDDVLDLLCRHGYSDEEGARPMKRAVEQHLMQPLSRDILQGRLRAGDPIVARVEGGRVVFHQEEYGSGP